MIDGIVRIECSDEGGVIVYVVSRVMMVSVVI